MRRALRFGLPLAALCGILLPAHEAHASVDVPVIIVAVTLVGAAFGADVAFTAYDVGKARKNIEPDTKWMTAQTIVTAPQAVLGHVPMVFASVERHDDEVAGLFLPLSIWGNELATYGAWSLASTEVKPGPRYSVSWLVGADLPLTTAAFSSFFSEEHYARPWLSISEIALCSPQVALGVYQGIHDPANRSGWIGIAAWSGTLAVHGAVSLVLSLTHKPVEEPVEPPMPPPRPPPQPPPYYFNDPVKTLPSEGPPPLDAPPGPNQRDPSTPSDLRVPPPAGHAPKLHADIAPTPITDGFRVVPGITVFGTF